VVRLPCRFFFSSRRRHTRFSRDWSSDVCSSDLGAPQPKPHARHASSAEQDVETASVLLVAEQPDLIASCPPVARSNRAERPPLQIGRASCRERREICAVAVGSDGKRPQNRITT